MRHRPHIVEQWFWEAVAMVVGVRILVVIIVVVPVEAVHLVPVEAGEGVWAGWALVLELQTKVCEDFPTRVFSRNWDADAHLA